MSLDLLFLGSGTSAGVPMIGCDCAVCRSDDPRDRRSRASVLISYDDLHTEGQAAGEAVGSGAVTRQIHRTHAKHVNLGDARPKYE